MSRRNRRSICIMSFVFLSSACGASTADGPDWLIPSNEKGENGLPAENILYEKKVTEVPELKAVFQIGTPERPITLERTVYQEVSRYGFASMGEAAKKISCTLETPLKLDSRSLWGNGITILNPVFKEGPLPEQSRGNGIQLTMVSFHEHSGLGFQIKNFKLGGTGTRIVADEGIVSGFSNFYKTLAEAGWLFDFFPGASVPAHAPSSPADEPQYRIGFYSEEVSNSVSFTERRLDTTISHASIDLVQSGTFALQLMESMPGEEAAQVIGSVVTIENNALTGLMVVIPVFVQGNGPDGRPSNKFVGNQTFCLASGALSDPDAQDPEDSPLYHYLP